MYMFFSALSLKYAVRVPEGCQEDTHLHKPYGLLGLSLSWGSCFIDIWHGVRKLMLGMNAN
jgi:hypothetical protein